MIELPAFHVEKSGKTILHSMPFGVGENEKVIIDGPNGSGKTTLLKVIAGLETSSSNNPDLPWQIHDITYVHQDPFMFRGSVKFNLMFGLKSREIVPEESNKRMKDWSARLSIDKFLEQDARNLSGGEKKKTAIARALVIRPKFLLIDEPLAELDQTNSDRVIEILSQLEETTVIATTPFWDYRFASFRRIEMSEICQAI